MSLIDHFAGYRLLSAYNLNDEIQKLEFVRYFVRWTGQESYKDSITITSRAYYR